VNNVARWRDCHLCLADINHDNEVNIDDLVSVITSWGPCPIQPVWCGADVSRALLGNGAVDIDDLVAVVEAWGTVWGDTNGDGLTNIDDIVNVITSLGPCPTTPPPVVCEADITRSGNVDIDDLVAVITSWGPCP